MSIIWWVIIVAILLVVFRPWQIFGALLNAYIESLLLRTLWFWLPFRAFGRLVKEFRKKHSK